MLGQLCSAFWDSQSQPDVIQPGFEPGTVVSPLAQRCSALDRYAAWLLSGVGDALGYRNQLWEYNDSEPAIHQELQELGGLKNITAQLSDWPVSDDTVLHLATAEALATGKEGEELLQDVAARYVEGMKDMEGRKPGPSSILAHSQCRNGFGTKCPYSPDGTGCGAAMRSMCIGLYPCPEQLSTLVAIAVETGRMTHPHPTVFLGAVVSALFTSYAVQCRPITTWGLGLVKEACPIAKRRQRDWGYFTEKWEWTGPVLWPASCGPAERDEVYKSFSLKGWAGRSGHGAPMIALDELMSREGFHGGDSDSTAVIACCCWGLLHGTEGVLPGNYTHLEYRERLESSAEKLYALSHTGADKYDP
uniref:ADP-ribosylarginine hydrolase n=1 Tax=Oncorhynchus mykiss TaxID=8022 RepID=A0A8C7WGZ5_ONCMY